LEPTGDWRRRTEGRQSSDSSKVRLVLAESVSFLGLELLFGLGDRGALGVRHVRVFEVK